ncbi:exodeoxyribonuclease III [Gimibacter soli]|uniref:Exodeoxyribonuclease III n=1 Tax=Gimibacter soli TaxID=3024400 RepID=A0AAF0BMK1_9PROT|nr:exodeoxyribonuclease III [Gimibacter soli]WCL54616.1 exodeoxyribonuclease III [Gimibacter soli]
MRIVTWNINSVRARLDIVEHLIRTHQPDVLCLQETKVMDPDFPRRFFEDLGMPHLAIKGQKSHHGVAIAAKAPFAESYSLDWCGKGDARHIAVKLTTGQTVHNFYVPAGGDEPDPAINDKFAHKLQFLDEMIEWSKKLAEPSILVGDINVAPHPDDVWNHKQLLKVVSHTPVETDKLFTLLDAHQWVDVCREIVPLPEKLYSWWSYRSPDWSNADKGRRLDHVWTSPSLKAAIRGAKVLRDGRGWGEKPSDHAPVVADFEF